MDKYKALQNKIILSSVSLSLLCSCAEESTSCVIKGTKILTPKGPRPIESLKVGDIVTTYHDKQLKKSTITRTYTGQTRVTYKISIQGHKLEASPSHPVKTNKGWVTVSSLTPQHKILLKNKLLSSIDNINITHKTSPETVYNIETSPHHNFFANEILTHNKTFIEQRPCPYIITSPYSLDALFGFPAQSIEFNNTISSRSMLVQVEHKCIDDKLSVDIVDNNNVFSISGFKQDGSFTISFNPQTQGTYDALLILSNKTDSVNITLIGNYPEP